jgi:predicted small lipoprotein YifL
MKKLLSMSLVLMFAFTLTACGGEKEEKMTDNEETTMEETGKTESAEIGIGVTISDEKTTNEATQAEVGIGVTISE